MRLFTGEASLYRSAHHYASVHTSAPSPGRVVAQQSDVAFLRRRPGRPFVVRGRITAVDGGATASCACFRVCDSRGNCSACHCDPPGCSTCD